MSINTETLELLKIPKYELLRTKWKRREFLPFATTKKGTNYKQIEAFETLFDDNVDELLFGGGARGGKTFLGCTWVLFNCLTMPKSCWLIMRKDLTRIKDTTVPTMEKVLTEYGVSPTEYDVIGINTGATYTFKNGSKILFRGVGDISSDPNFNKFGGFDLTGAFLEEVQEMPFKVVEILKGRFSVLEGDLYSDLEIDFLRKTPQWITIKDNLTWKAKPKTLMTCNPSKNWIYRLFYEAKKKGKLLHYRRFIPALVTDNPNVSVDYINSLKTAGKETRERLLYGNFDYDDDDKALITFEEINALFTNEHVKIDMLDKTIIIDPALEGRDGCGIWVFYGCVMVERIIHDKLTPKEFIEAVNKVKGRHQVMNHKIIFDAVGLGALTEASFSGAVQYKENRSAMIIEDKAKPKYRHEENKQPFKNLGSQCGYKLASMVNNGLIYIRCILSEGDKDSIVEQLGQIKTVSNLETADTIELLNKEAIKSEIGYSPTDLDGLKMFAWSRLELERKPARKPLVSYGDSF